MKKLMSAIAMASILGLAGCGSVDRAVPETAPPAAVLSDEGRALVSALREGIDHKVFASPTDLVESRTAAYLGSIDAVLPGQILRVPSDLGATRESEIVLRIRIDRTLKADDRVVSNGYVYVTLGAGISLLDSTGNVVGENPNPTLADLQEGLNVGTRVLVVGQPAEDDSADLAGVEVESTAKGLPAGVTPIDGRHPQAVTFNQGETTLDEWPGLTFGDLEREMR